MKFRVTGGMYHKFPIGKRVIVLLYKVETAFGKTTEKYLVVGEMDGSLIQQTIREENLELLGGINA